MYEHITKNFYLYDFQDLQRIEYNYMFISKQLQLNFHPQFTTFIQYAQRDNSHNAYQETQDIFSVKKIIVNNSMIFMN